MSPRIIARLLLVVGAAALSACSNPVAPVESALRTSTDRPAACSGVFGGVSTRTCSDTTSTLSSTSTSSTTESTETTTLSSCSGVFGGVSTRCDED